VLAGPPLPPHGLRGRYYAAPGWQGDVVLQRVDATFVNAFDSDKRMSVLWDAELTIATPGVYTFTLTTAKESLLAIDGHDVVMNPGHADNVIGAQGAVALGAGQHALSIRYDRYFNNGTMELRWTLPDGSSEIVPVDLLQPETGQ
jgi:hypothetical protein